MSLFLNSQFFWLAKYWGAIAPPCPPPPPVPTAMNNNVMRFVVLNNECPVYTGTSSRSKSQSQSRL